MEKEGKQREHACESFPVVFHREMRSEVLLCWQPQGADETPGNGKENGMTGSIKAQRLDDTRQQGDHCANGTLYVQMK